MIRRLLTAVVCCVACVLFAGGCSQSPSKTADGGSDIDAGKCPNQYEDPDSGMCEPCGGIDPLTLRCLPPPLQPPPPPPTPPAPLSPHGSPMTFGPPQPPPQESPDSFQADFIDAYCDYLTRCGFGIHGNEKGTRDKALCVQEMTQRANEFDGIGLREQDLDGGLTSFNPSRAGLCLQDLKNLTCNTQLLREFQLTDCAQTFTGTGTESFPCETGADCAAGYICLLPNAATTTVDCLGSCEPASVYCNSDQDCLSGQICSDQQDCRARNPAPSDLGGPCGEGDSCNVNYEQGIGMVQLLCYPDTGPNGTVGNYCEYPKGPSQACDILGRCASGLSCQLVNGTFGCWPDTPASYGRSCDPSDENSCLPGLVCVPGARPDVGVCLVQKSLGDPCTGQTLECGGILAAGYCDTDAGVDAGPGGSPFEVVDGGTIYLADGGAMTTTVDGGMYVGTCEQRPSTGPCPGNSPYGCNPLNSYCDMQYIPDGGMQPVPTCMPFKSNGDPCTSATECGPWYLNPACILSSGANERTCSVAPSQTCPQ